MNPVQAFILGLIVRRREDRRTPGASASFEHAVAVIRETKYTGWFMVHAAEGVPKRVEFPHPIHIHLER